MCCGKNSLLPTAIEERVMKRQLNICFLFFVLGGYMLIGIGSLPTHASRLIDTIIVNSLADPGDGSCDTVECTFHEALVMANATQGTNLIAFNLPAGPQTITLTEPLPLITESVTVDGGQEARITISGGGQFRVLDVADNTIVHLQKLIIANGAAHSSQDAVEPERGGGIRNAGALYIDHTILQDNSADEGGGVYNTGLLVVKNTSSFVRNVADDGHEGGTGGAIYNAYKLIISKSFIGGKVEEDRNRAVSSGGGIYNAPGSYAQIWKGTVIAFNRAWRGGGITNTANSEITIDNTTFNANGGIWNAGQESAGAIWNQDNGVVKITSSSFLGNLAYYRGGAIVNGGMLTIADSTFQRNFTLDMGGAMLNSGLVMIYRTTFADQESWNWAGAIANGRDMRIYDSLFTGNTSWDGAALLNGGDLYISGSTFSKNHSDYNGSISNNGRLEVVGSTFHHNQGDSGAAIFNQYRDGNVFIYNSTFSDNEALTQGGAIANLEPARLTVENSTFTGNVARGYGTYTSEGGAIYNGSVATITFSTISGNRAQIGGGLFNLNASYAQGTMNVKGTIVANNPAAISGGDCAGVMISQGYNLESDGSCNFQAPGDLMGDPLLGPLQLNDGPTETMALLPGSPAIDRIPTGDCMVNNDQRGVLRPQGVACDIGAFEVAVGIAP
jgi:hypothetical protein